MKNFISSPMFTLRSLEFLQKVLLACPQVGSLQKKNLIIVTGTLL